MSSEQPMPTPGRQAVTPVARELFAAMLAERERKGIETYGRSLETHNGRDAVQDALEECADLWQYLVQIKLERDAARVGEQQADDARISHITARHEPFDFGMVRPGSERWISRVSCKGCHRPWPCEQSVLGERLDALASEASDVARENEALIEEVKAAGEQIAALAAERDARIKTLENDLEHALASVGAFRQAIETIFEKADAHEVDQGGMIVTYVLPCGPLHRAIGLARGTDAGGKLLAERDALRARAERAESERDVYRDALTLISRGVWTARNSVESIVWGARKALRDGAVLAAASEGAQEGRDGE